MKRIIIIIILSVSFYSADACEICGCGVGNYYIGIMPHFKNKFIGLRYQFNSFHTKLNDDPTQFSKDFYQTVELWSGWNLGKHFQLLTFVPFNFNHQSSDEGITNLKGLGDIALLLNYKVFERKNMKTAQQLWLGAGVKIPTGKFEIEPGDPDIAASANGQRGSGSADIMFNTTYTVSFRKWGINTNAGYKINSTNKEQYKFGNKFSASSFVFYTLQASKTIITPNAGLLYEHNKASELDNAKVNLTGGNLLTASAGTEISFNKMSVGFNLQVPVSQNFAEGQTKSNMKGMVHVTFAL